MSLDKEAVRSFIRARALGVVSTVSQQGAPEAALVNLAVTEDLELVFYALETTRKCVNLRREPRLAAVIGWDGAKTLQYEGIADEPGEPELDGFKRLYGEARPDAALQMAWPGLTWFRVRPSWIRFSDYGAKWSVEEMTFPAPRRR